MQKMYSEQGLVRVWRNTKVLGMPSMHFGHAAVTVHGMSVPTTATSCDANTQHISFWPADGVEHVFGENGVFRPQAGAGTEHPGEDRINELNPITMIRLEVGYRLANSMPVPNEWLQYLSRVNKGPLAAPRTGQKRLTDEDGAVIIQNKGGINCPMWSQSPEVKIFLPGLLAHGVLWGLNLRLMADWWTKFMAGKPQYTALARQNCAGVVLWALQAGGSELFAKCPDIRVYGEPTQVEQYARTLEERFRELEFQGTLLTREVARLIDWRAPAMDVSAGLWTLAAWKKASALGITSPRSALICQIDAGVDEYQRLTWKANPLGRYGALLKVFQGIVKHRAAKADSHRSEAVLKLASQVLNLLKSHRLYD